MNILLFDMGSFTYRDIKEELLRQGHNVEGMYYHFADRYCDTFFDERIRLKLRQISFDAVISINFFPLLAVACHEAGVPYISWSYDSPLDEKLADYFGYDTNYIFLFDREEVEGFNKAGYSNVMHLPLAVNTSRLEALKLTSEKKYSADISFIGRIYESSLETLMLPADEYVKGYVEGLFQAQFRIYGCNFLEKSIPDEVIETLNNCYAKLGQTQIKLSKKGLAYAIAAQITHFERSFLVEELAQLYDVHLYSDKICDFSDEVKQHGPVKYFDEMNRVFVSSKLNLCPTLKSIASGIPLRALDIMGAGGVLFSNYQPELAEYFEDGTDVIMYESIEDAFAKAEYYLNNCDELGKIAACGHDKVKKYFDYSGRIEELLRVI